MNAILQTIEVGLNNDEAAAITSGLTAGEPVILAPEHSLTSGTRVQPIAR